MLMNSLVYGTARLTGGVSERAARRLVAKCLDFGVTRFDTAPSYGIGTAERVLGNALLGLTQARVSTKVGLLPPKWSYLQTCARAIKRSCIREKRLGLPANSTLMFGPSIRREGSFDLRSVTQSFKRSQVNLKRNVVDELFLHEVYQADVPDDVIDWLIHQSVCGVARSGVGYSHSGVFDNKLDCTFPQPLIAQTAIPPHWFESGFPQGTRPHNFHSVVKTLRYLCATSPIFTRRLHGVCTALAGCGADHTAIQIASLLAVVHSAQPRSGLIVASIDETRLEALLRAVRFIDAEVGALNLANIYWAHGH